MSAALVLMCGLAFSGKSTVARTIALRLDAQLVSLDDINDERGLWGGHGIPVAEWQCTHELARARLHSALAAGRAVVLDDTSNLRLLRDGYRELARVHSAPFVLVFVNTPLEDIRQRRAEASVTCARRSVDDAVFAEHAASFESPQADEAAVVHRPDDSHDELLAEIRRSLSARPSDDE
jgi:predicted kinase